MDKWVRVEDTGKLKKDISIVADRLAKGAVLATD